MRRRTDAAWEQFDHGCFTLSANHQFDALSFVPPYSLMLHWLSATGERGESNSSTWSDESILSSEGAVAFSSFFLFCSDWGKVLLS